ncbi:hypothetical protein UPYG_G00227660 [Umbra pygmaea]|uniref:Immunoglobulin V-set domain-containing protein n=1 Tax=Umbra pygmaea TaxID=75934 RepID=A0ABD0WV19_UMBPY
MSSTTYELGLFFIVFSCPVMCVKFDQSASLIKDGGKEVDLHCSHDDSTLLMMFWYQQKQPSPVLALIGYIYGSSDPNYEDQFKTRFKMKRDGVLKGKQSGSGDLVLLQPRHLFTLPGNTSTSPVSLRCSMGPGLSMSSYTMLWYRQIHYGGPVEFLIKEFDITLGRYQVTLDPSENWFILQCFRRTLVLSEIYRRMFSTTYGRGFFFIIFSCPVMCVKFDQSASLIKDDGKKVEIHCSHDDSNLVVMLWYQQKQPSPVMALIGYGYSSSDPNYEDQFKTRFKMKRDGVMKGKQSGSEDLVVLQPRNLFTLPGNTSTSPVSLRCSMGPGLSMSSYTMLWMLVLSELYRRMSSTTYRLELFFIIFSCPVMCVKFDQSASLIKDDGKKVEIHCSHDDSSLLVMLWYQQKQPSPVMALIGYGYSTADPNYEDQFKTRFKMKRDGVLKGKQSGSGDLVLLQPRHLFTLPGNTSTSLVSLRCSMGPGLSMSSYTMLWYPQVHYGDPVEFLIKEFDTTLGRYQMILDPSENWFILQVWNI